MSSWPETAWAGSPPPCSWAAADIASPSWNATLARPGEAQTSSAPAGPSRRAPGTASSQLLARSVRVLRDQAPDVLESLGTLKIPVDLGDGPADAMLCSRRPVYEAVVRQALTAEPTVSVQAGTTVTDLVVRPGRRRRDRRGRAAAGPTPAELAA